jgi:hypothetical protein
VLFPLRDFYEAKIRDKGIVWAEEVTNFSGTSWELGA